MLQWHRGLNGFQLQQFLQGVRIGESMGIITWFVESDQRAAVLRCPGVDLATAALGEFHQAFEQGHLEQAKHRLRPNLAIADRATALRLTFDGTGRRVTGVEFERDGEVSVAHVADGAQVVLAGNCMLPEFGPRVAPDITPRIMPVGTYIVGTEPLPPELCARLIPSNAAVCDNNFVLDYFRLSADTRMLFGGRVSYTTSTPKHLKQVMAQRMTLVFPALQNVAVDYVWGGFVDISMNRAPDFGRLGSNLFYLQGFSGHGVGEFPE